MLVLTAVVVWVVEGLLQHFENTDVCKWLLRHLFYAGDNRFWETVVPVYAAVLLGLFVWRSRSRIVIDSFVDFTADNVPVTTAPAAREKEGAAPGTSKPAAADKVAASGLSTLLLIELARLIDVYRDVDEARAVPTTAGVRRAMDATIKVDDVNDLLRTAVSAESRVSLGPFQLPVGTLLSVFAKILQGPRITGSLHRQGDRLMLAAQRSRFRALLLLAGQRG